MGMGNYPCSANKIEESFVESQCPELLEGLKAVMDDIDISFDTFCQYLDSTNGQDNMENDGIDAEDQQKLKLAYQILQARFEKMTGLTLDVTYSVSSEDADRGCDVTGGIWCVGGVWVRTPAGRIWENQIEEVNWTVFG
jgi:hypothetical protein